MVEKDVLLKRLTLLEEYVRDLEEVKDKSLEEFKSDKVIRRYVERTLHMATEACLDVANHIISYEGFREPKDNKDSFEVLMEEKIIMPELTEKLKKIAQFRNVVVHDYIRIKPEIVYNILQNNINDIVFFAKCIKNRFL
ncbi:MAG: DUF86 domain-containing protein [Clostridiaceae bacterium]|jgi:uncharacterized protein YutE (UPF0331/DUF86 family)|nr:DUF86 domain-containing protein [Clostridiaceae bacterium]